MIFLKIYAYFMNEKKIFFNFFTLVLLIVNIIKINQLGIYKFSERAHIEVVFKLFYDWVFVRNLSKKRAFMDCE